MLRMKPAFAISEILILPLAKIIVLGGVATGSINAIEADSVAVNISRSGFKPIAIENEATIGRIICVNAVLEVSSVKNVTKVAVNIIAQIGEIDERPANCSPINSDRPVEEKPFAKANPPPNNRITPQGTLLNEF